MNYKTAGGEGIGTPKLDEVIRQGTLETTLVVLKEALAKPQEGITDPVLAVTFSTVGEAGEGKSAALVLKRHEAIVAGIDDSGPEPMAILRDYSSFYLPDASDPLSRSAESVEPEASIPVGDMVHVACSWMSAESWATEKKYARKISDQI